MKAILSSLITGLILAQSALALKPGDTIPAQTTTMKNTDGKMVSIADSIGKKGTLVVFTCNHCPFVIAWQERMVKAAKHCQQQDIGIIFINSNSPAVKAGDDFPGMQALAKENSYSWPYVVDQGSAVAKSFGASRTPEVFLFDAQGKLAYHGAVDDNGRMPAEVKERWLDDAITAVLAGKEPAIPATKSVGCSIKWY